MDAVTPTLGQTLGQLLLSLWQLLAILVSFALPFTLLILWGVWWLFAVNWKKLAPTLREGGWAPLVLLWIVAALVWSRFEAVSCHCLGFPIPNFWWQLGEVGLFLAVALFAGWLQGILHVTPPELDLDPPVHGFEHVHDHSLAVHAENVPHDAHGHHH